jgi:hypothetical protein
MTVKNVENNRFKNRVQSDVNKTLKRKWTLFPTAGDAGLPLEFQVYVNSVPVCVRRACEDA